MEQSYKEKYEQALSKAKDMLNYKEVRREDMEYLFPELAESKDEKIRKEIISFLQLPHSQFVGERKQEKWIAWLEKQGTPAKLSEEEQNRFAKGVLTSCALSFIDYLDAHKYEGKMCVSNGECEDIENAFHNAMWDRLHRYYCKYIEKQGEQKPQRMISAEAKEAMYDKPAWSEEDVRVIDDIFYSINEESVIEGLNDRGIMYALKDIRGIVKYLRNWLQDLKRRVQPQPKQEWSEEEIEPIISDYLCGREHYGGMIGRLCHLKPKQKQTEWGEDDEAFLDDILCKLEHDLILNKDEKDWLKSLKLQPKQSLDEDTQQWIDTIIKDYEDLYNTDKDHRATIQAKISILKSLRPQNRWKPSELQLECLSDAIEYYNSSGYPATKLKELLDDLKKLKGEV